MEEKNSYLSADPETIRQIDEKMPPEEELQDLAEFFKVFGDATRLKILSVLLCSDMILPRCWACPSLLFLISCGY